MNRRPRARRMIAPCLLTAAWLTVAGSAFAATVADNADPQPPFRDWIEAMKTSERGPFSRVLWFCADGSELPPSAYACRDHGGGVQHGKWSSRTETLRRNGFKIANLLAGIDADASLQQDDFRDTLGQMLVEKFLVGVDDGWIMRQAMFYRGAVQDEDERAGAQALLQAMARQPQWLTTHFTALRTAARMLPHTADSATVQQVRQVSASLSERDGKFRPLRAKIHGAPDSGDAARVRDYAGQVTDPSLRAAYQQLAADIDQVYQAEPLQDLLRERADAYRLAPWLQQLLREAADRYAAADAAGRFRYSAQLMADLRESLPAIQSPRVRLQVLDLSLRTEQEHFRAATELRGQLSRLTRAQLFDLLRHAATASYGAGLLNQRLHREVQALWDAEATDSVALDSWLRQLNWLARAPAWGSQALRMHFQDAMNTLAQLEPAAQLFIQDQLRGSPLLFYADVMDLLMRDANRLMGVRHQLFDQEIGFGLTALNPGLARGVLRAESTAAGPFQSNGIYLLPETLAELPPVAGILTAGEGNPLSHIQLLARNLGIPNVVVDDALLPHFVARDGHNIVLAVSPLGMVELHQDSPQWDVYFPQSSATDKALISPDLNKLDLSLRQPLPLSRLRAEDSGRIVGPKAAKLGELRAHYPQAVARGVALPFGIFHQQVLLQAWAGDASGNTTVFDWMVDQYRQLEALSTDKTRQANRAEAFRAELYAIIVNTRLSPDLQQALETSLSEVFGNSDLPGLFIRSDTNVEDLPGFTGAGLNLTLPNVVGLQRLIADIPRVWASPFTARAFAWRQALMDRPEHVYTSVLLLESVPVDKSGVLVTRDIDSGATGVLSVAVNEGPGGAVDGQAAESLRLPMDGSPPVLLATATAPWRRELLPQGGIRSVPSSGSDQVLEADEMRQLIEFAKRLPETFPAITDAAGNAAPADVEFGFLDGSLRLFQIRPFLDSAQARGSAYLQEMDARLSSGRAADRPQRVRLTQRPQP